MALTDAASEIAARAERTVPGVAARRFIADGMSERAASLAFYALFSLIPVLLIAAAAFELVGDAEAVADVQDAARDAGASSSVSAVLRSMLDTAVEADDAQAGGIGVAGLATLLYGASKVFTDAGRALDRIRGAGRAARPLRKRAADLGWTIALVACGFVLGVLTFVTGKLLDAVGLEGVHSLWNLARWPVALGLTVAALAVVTWAGPTVARRPFRLVTPGALVTVGLWLTATAGYSVYLGNFARYNATYGAFAAIIILMLWLWFSCLTFLYGAEIDAVLDERRARATRPGPP
jgi:membrane protein